MKVVELYTGLKNYVFPNGKLATPDAVYEKFPAAKHFAYVVETDEGGEVMWAFNNLSSMRVMHNIDKSLSETEAIAALEKKLNVPKETVTIVSAEERIAAALEYQNLMSMEDVED